MSQATLPRLSLLGGLLLSALLLASQATAQSDGQDEPLQFDAETPQIGSARGREGTVYKSRIDPYWSADGNRFWYRNDLRDGKREYILVQADRGERRPAFDHQRLTERLVEAGLTGAVADRLQLDRLEFEDGSMTFTAGKQHWRCDLTSYTLSRIDAPRPSGDERGAAVRVQDAPRASTRTGPETELLFRNSTEDKVELFWLDTDGARRSYGTLSAGEERSQHTYAGHVWLVVNGQGRTVGAFVAREQPALADITGREPAPISDPRRRPAPAKPEDGSSPDGRWRAFVRDGNVFVAEAAADGRQWQLTHDGNSEVGYGQLEWSPDSQSLAAFRIEPGDQKEVFLVESSPPGGGRAVLHRRPYALPGDKFTSYQLALFRLAGKAESTDNPWQTISPDVEPVDFGRPQVRWSREGRTLRYTKIDRGHQRLRLIEVDVQSGRSHYLIDEQTETFIWTAHTEQFNARPVTWLDETEEVIYASEVDGWRHLYLIDTSKQADGDAGSTHSSQIASGGRRLTASGLKCRITQGEWVVRGIDRVDEQQRQIWFRASGLDGEQDPYLVHFCRVNFDGTELVRLTTGNGNHSLQHSPDGRYLIDTYSRVDAPPIHELRQADNGRLLCTLEQADASELVETGWSAPEVFVAKGRDGTTDIWGIICRPRDFDSNKKYPVLEDLYAGPHGSFVPKTFSPRERYQALNEAGFIVVKIDGMGTANRSKTFHDVCWHNLKDAGLPDRILWLQAAAEKYPYLDLTRVGVYGGSAGGQNAVAALLFHPEFYKVAVAGCGCHDNRMDKASWNEQWMGYPVGEQYAASSNIDHAARLQGKLLLIVGEMDTNVPPESTLRLADALIKADKDFELLVVPGAGHGMGGAYGQRRLHEFFVRHLLGK